ncbi:MAG: MFS transporter [Pseudomonadota bacterium]|nr:MFS transporter [Pseudomonadota bacterium]
MFSAPGQSEPWSTVAALGITQITAWGSIYYVFALLMEQLQADLHASKTVIVGAFSVALLVAGLLAPFVGSLIDRYGGRALMTTGSIVGGLALIALGHVTTIAELYVVWVVLGAAMAATLYEPAFAVLTRLFAMGYRRAITVLTLFGGFASTVFWPLTQLLIDHYGWRDSVAILGLLNLVVCAPLHAWMLPGTKRVATAPDAEREAGSTSTNLRQALAERSFYLLCAAFTANALVFSAMAVHMLPMLIDKGLSAFQAAAVGAMVGPMQVLGRLVEMFIGSRFKASLVAVMAMTMLPLSLVLFYFLGPVPAAFVAFAFLYGAGNGVMTIVRGTVPAEFYGLDHYGAVNGAMAMPVLLAKASGPLIAAAIWVAAGSYSTVALVLAAIAATSVASFIMVVSQVDRVGSR